MSEIPPIKVSSAGVENWDAFREWAACFDVLWSRIEHESRIMRLPEIERLRYLCAVLVQWRQDFLKQEVERNSYATSKEPACLHPKHEVIDGALVCSICLTTLIP